MEPREGTQGLPPDAASPAPGPGLLLLPLREFLGCRKGRLLLAQALQECIEIQGETRFLGDTKWIIFFMLLCANFQFTATVLSFIIFICYIASSAAAFLMVPLLTFLLALCFFFAYSLKLNEKFKAIYWVLADFLCGIIAAIIYFAISIAAVSKYSDTASKAAGVFGFIATIIYCVYVYFTFNDLTTYLKQGDSSDAPEPGKSEDDDSDSDSD